MSYPPQPAFPNSAFPNAGFPEQQQQQQQWQQQDFYTPTQPQQQHPQASYSNMAQQQQHPQQQVWGSEAGARQRPGMAVDPNGQGQVAFMPPAAAQLMANPMAGMAFDYGKASFAKNVRTKAQCNSSPATGAPAVQSKCAVNGPSFSLARMCPRCALLFVCSCRG